MMPLYQYQCPKCGSKEELFRSVARRHDYVACCCGGMMKKEFGVPHLDIISPYFDEGLGCDIQSASHRRRVMRQLNVIEAGDRVGGAINFDRHAPHHVGRMPVQGKEWAPVVHKDQPVETVDSDGRTVSAEMFSQLEDSR